MIKKNIFIYIFICLKVSILWQLQRSSQAVGWCKLHMQLLLKGLTELVRKCQVIKKQIFTLQPAGCHTTEFDLEKRIKGIKYCSRTKGSNQYSSEHQWPVCSLERIEMSGHRSCTGRSSSIKAMPRKIWNQINFICVCLLLKAPVVF